MNFTTLTLDEIDCAQQGKDPVNPGISYIRFSKEMKEFFELVNKKHQITGFTWDENDPWNFGILIKDKEK